MILSKLFNLLLFWSRPLLLFNQNSMKWVHLCRWVISDYTWIDIADWITILLIILTLICKYIVYCTVIVFNPLLIVILQILSWLISCHLARCLRIVGILLLWIFINVKWALNICILNVISTLLFICIVTDMETSIGNLTLVAHLILLANQFLNVLKRQAEFTEHIFYIDMIVSSFREYLICIYVC